MGAIMNQLPEQFPNSGVSRYPSAGADGTVMRVRLLDADQMSGVRQGWSLECRQLNSGAMLADLTRLVTPQGKIGR